MSFYLAVVGTKDTPIYELEFGTNRQGGGGQSKVGTGEEITDCAILIKYSSPPKCGSSTHLYCMQL